MCTLALYLNLFPDFPLVVAANRDEHYDRPSSPPGLIRTDPAIIAGRDLRAGGTWLGVNENGLIAGVLNRRSVTNTAANNEYRSRGLLCLETLEIRHATDVCHWLHGVNATAYQPFTLISADKKSACVAYNLNGGIETMPLQPGLHVFSNTASFEGPSEKVTRIYEKFLQVSQAGAAIDGVAAYVQKISRVLADHELGDGPSDPREAICVHGDVSGTVSSSIIFYSENERQFQTYYCAGTPCRHQFVEYPHLSVR